MNIGIVLVTFNRLSHLEKTIRLYEQQTKLPEYILVVDNHSTDGTGEFLKNWVKEDSAVQHKLITLPQNLGGSGGFYAGTELAAKLDADWIWLADDDAYPDKRALEELEKFAERHTDVMKKTAALCTKNYGDNGISRWHRDREKRFLFSVQLLPVPEEDYKKEFFYMDAYSFVGAVLKKEVLQKAGLPNKDFFIYADDTEHALRMKKYGKIVCVPSAKVYHNDNNRYSREASWRDYYLTKNILLTLKWHYGKYSYFVRSICRMLTACRSGNIEKIRINWLAVRDAAQNKVGIHPVYRPGWQPTKKY